MRAFLVFIIFLLAMVLFTSAYLRDVDLTPNTAAPALAAAPSAAAAEQPEVITIQESPVIFITDAAIVPVTGGCADPYIVLPGDWLLKISRGCNTNLAAILQDNPQIANPDLIYPDQRINLHTASQPVPIPVSGLSPSLQSGTQLLVQASELPPNTAVNIAIGPRSVGYTIVASGFTDASGSLNTHITVPTAPDPLAPWVVVVATTTFPSMQVVSPSFYIR